jgi:hypothetical protein
MTKKQAGINQQQVQPNKAKESHLHSVQHEKPSLVYDFYELYRYLIEAKFLFSRKSIHSVTYDGGPKQPLIRQPPSEINQAA